EREKAARRPRFAAVKNALGGFAWSWRGATMAAAPTSPAGDGLRTLSYAAAPLAVAARPITERAPAPKRALWKRVLGLGGKKR
ncbi:MAG: hypothetical protein KC635_12480, partial [Myxococcales bacterium]|nr:hypothetical protein [Myxococcales bacterium]